MGTAAAGVGRLQSRGGKQTQRTVNRLRVTLLSAFITFLLFRATIGINRLAHYGSAVTVSGHARIAEDIDRVLREIRSDTDDLDDDALDAATATTRFHHAGAPWSMNYSLAPRVTRWNARRRRWLHAHPGFPSTDARGDESVLLVTASPPGPCVSPAGDHLLLRAAKNKADYCRLHGLDMVHDMAAPAAHRELTGPGWSKLPLLRRLMLAHPEAEWLWWLDAGAAVTDMGFHLPLSRYVTSNLVVHGHHHRLFRRRHGQLPAPQLPVVPAGAARRVGHHGAQGPRPGRGRKAAHGYPDRPARGRRRRPVAARAPAAHGGGVVDGQGVRRERVPPARRVGGDRGHVRGGHGEASPEVRRRTVAIRHALRLVRALPEGGEGDYAPDRCVKGMERAFNFADNQVLRLYGFEHRTLESAVASRVANRSVDPLEAKEAISYLRKPKDPPAPKKKSLRKNRKRRVKGGSVLARILVKLGWRD